MAIGGAVWGIDIGQCGIKALRGRMSSDGTSVVADNFEYIEYPKILSQPDADPGELIREALKQLISRNPMRGDKVCVSVAGQSGLARFIDLPPVEAKKLPELVGFEAKQQIPFALEDVVWDYQKMPDVLAAGEEEEDDMMPAENVVGLFAMKRDQVLRFIQPLVDEEVELDIVQLTPIAIYNAIAFDQFPLRSEESEIDPNHWTVVISLGTDNSDLVITNGFRVWQRSIPIGGNHFTKQLTKEMKLTFAKAEHMKRNAREAADAKEVFRAMRPTFNDLVTEIQRTLGFFESLDRDAELTRTIVVGNAAKLPGLTQYLEKNLDRKVIRLDEYQRMTGDGVVEESLFKENSLAFPVCYGLVLQGLGKSKLKTNLIPREILKQRLIRSKKPWFVAIAASLLLGMAFNYFFNWRAWHAVHENTKTNNVSWVDVTSRVDQLKQQCSRYESRNSEQLATLERLDEIGNEAVGSADGRLLWLELMKAITAALPGDKSGKLPTLKERPLLKRKEIYIERVESQYFTDLTQWFDETVQGKYQEQVQVRQEQAALEREANQQEPVEGEAPPPATPEPPVAETPEVSEEGWVIEIQGFHFQHNTKIGEGSEYVRQYLVDQLEFGEVVLPGPDGQPEKFKMKELGILAPVEVWQELDEDFAIANPDAAPAPQAGVGEQRPGVFGQNRQTPPSASSEVSAIAYRFRVQFVWKQIPNRQRIEARIKAKEAAAQELGGP